MEWSLNFRFSLALGGHRLRAHVTPTLIPFLVRSGTCTAPDPTMSQTLTPRGLTGYTRPETDNDGVKELDSLPLSLGCVPDSHRPTSRDPTPVPFLGLLRCDP